MFKLPNVFALKARVLTHCAEICEEWFLTFTENTQAKPPEKQIFCR